MSLVAYELRSVRCHLAAPDRQLSVVASEIAGIEGRGLEVDV